MGPVTYANIMTDRHSGRSKGCGVVEFENAADVGKAIDTMNNSDFMGREIRIREDREQDFQRRDRPPRDDFDRGGDRNASYRREDNPELEKKMDTELDDYFNNKKEEAEAE